VTELSVAIAGAGAISEFHLKGWKEQKEVKLVAICDPELSRAKKRADAFGIDGVYTDAAEMLKAEKPDALDVITPVGTHAKLVQLAAESGVDVMCQKPMVATVEEAEKLIEEVGDRVRFMIHENYRFRPHYAEIAERVRQGQVGQPRHVRMSIRSSSVRDYAGKIPFLLERQPYLREFERLAVFEFHIHQLDALRSIFGELTIVSAHLDRLNPELRGEDTALITLRGDNGLLVQLDACTAALGQPPLPTDRLEIIGDKDSLILDGDRITLLSDPENVQKHDLAKNYQACFSGAIDAFVEGLRNGTPFPTDRLDNLKTLKLMESVYTVAANAR
jgi:D-apiose dehydrogenase